MHSLEKIRAVAFTVVAALALGLPLAAQTAPASTPTDDKPLRFRAFAVSLQAGASTSVQIVIERWTTDEERQALLSILAQQGQDKLRDALQDIKDRCGYLRAPNTLGWDIKYARENLLPDGTRQIVIATDKPVSFLAASRNLRTMDYPFTLVEMRFSKDKKGEGRMLMATAIAIKNNRLELENYGHEPVRLSSITEEGRER